MTGPPTDRFFLIGSTYPVRVKSDMFDRAFDAHSPDETRKGELKHSMTFMSDIRKRGGPPN
jgi:hypothetical protein